MSKEWKTIKISPKTYEKIKKLQKVLRLTIKDIVDDAIQEFKYSDTVYKRTTK